MEFKLLFAIDKSRQSYISQFAKSLEKKGVKCKIIDDLDIYDSSLTNKKIFRWLKKPTKLQKIIDEFQPDAVFTERVSHLGSLILKMKIPLIIFLRGDYWNEMKALKDSVDGKGTKQIEIWAKQKIAEKCFKESTIILPICKYLEKITHNRYPNNLIRVMYQGIDPDNWTHQERMELKHPCVGLLQDANIWEKTKEMMILPKILEKMPDVHFYWAGDGAYRDKVLPMLEKYENFHWLGRLSYPDKVREFLTEIDVYALISGMDMSPHTILEASLMKKPVIATDVGGISESIQENAGFLINQNDHEEWIKKISFLLDNKQEISKMGNGGHSYVKKQFSWEKISDDFLNIIKNETDIIK